VQILTLSPSLPPSLPSLPPSLRIELVISLFIDGLSDSLALTRTWTFWSSSKVVRENAGKVREGGGGREGGREGRKDDCFLGLDTHVDVFLVVVGSSAGEQRAR
jgi:hypothetical protein